MPKSKRAPHKRRPKRITKPAAPKKIDLLAQDHLNSCPGSLLGATDWLLKTLPKAGFIGLAKEDTARLLIGHAICRALAAKQEQLGVLQVRLQRLEHAAFGQLYEALDRNSKQRILERAKQGFAWDEPDEG